MQDSLGDRIKRYEECSNYKFTNRVPIIIRIDGKAFHSWTKKTKCVKPFDSNLINLMSNTTKYLCENISGCICGYCQSDEISLCLINSQNNETQPWFDNRIQKMVSVSASLATYYFNSNNMFEHKCPALFDSRAFVVPEKDIINYFIWRQRDASRNSISMLAQSMYSNKNLLKKTSDEKIQMCKDKGVDWNNLPNHFKYGSFVYRNQSNEPLVNKITGEISYRKHFIIDQNINVFEYKPECIINTILIENNIKLF